MREVMRGKRMRVGVAAAALAVALAAGVTLGATLRDGDSGATAQTAETPATALPANPPTCTARTLGVSRASNPGLAADCDTLLAIKSTLRVSGWIDYDAPAWRDHSYALNWSARSPLTHWRTVTLGSTPLRVTGLDFSDSRESVRVLDAHTRSWAASQPYTREWTLRGVIPTQLGNLTALETLDFGDSELTGVVPTQLGTLTKLTRLDLGDNKLTGAIPTQLGSLTVLTSLDLSGGNAFTGCIPGPLWVATTHDLKDLDLLTCTDGTIGYETISETGANEPFGAGTYKMAFQDQAGDDYVLVFTIPEGLRIEFRGVAVGLCALPEGCALLPAQFSGGDTGDGFGFCLDLATAEECGRGYPISRALGEPIDEYGAPLRCGGIDGCYANDDRAERYGPLIDQVVSSAHIEATP